MEKYNDSIYNCAKRRGYISENGLSASEWEKTFVGCWVKKYKNRLKELDAIRALVNGGDKNGRLPEWSDLTSAMLKAYKEDVLGRMCANSAHTEMNRLKSIISYMKDEIDIPCKGYSDILSCRMEASEHVFLTEDEIIAFAHAEVKNDAERYVQSVCVIEAITGARHIDCLRMRVENIEDGILTYTSQKTKKSAKVPALFNVENWLVNIPPVEMDDVTFNDTIRTIMKRAEIGMQKKTIFCGGKEQTKMKYEFVATHTFRRSYATNMFLGGIDLPDISQMMGHTSTEMTMKYICATRFVSVPPRKIYTRRNVYKYEMAIAS